MATFLNSKAILDNSITLDKIGESVEWTQTSNINEFQNPGFFKITGTRNNLNDGLPIYNTGKIEAQLLVLKNDDNNISQTLTLLNVDGGGDSNVYVRSKKDDVWKSWGKMQTNIEVGQVNTLDNFTDNGMYSGVLTNGSTTTLGTFYDTFVLIVINNYSVSGPLQQPKGITQLKYSISLDGTVNVQTRRKLGETWTNWHKINDTERISDSNNHINKILEPNIYYMFDNVSSAEIAFGNNMGTGFNNYMFEMCITGSPNDGTVGEILLPADINWANGLAPSFKKGKTYQISVINNLGVFAEF